MCFVRARRGDQIVSTTYGRSSGFCIDPIEKKPLYHFLPGTAVLSFGTAGCNLACKFCQNWSISKARTHQRLQSPASPRQLAVAARSTGCRSVAYTYNDPVIFLEYAVDVATACREEGIRNVAVTAGYICAPARADLFGAMDAVNVDLKSFTEEFYWRQTGGHIEPVKETIVWLVHETQVWVEITTLLIPGLNDNAAEIHKLCGWVAETLGPRVPLHFSAFHPDWKMANREATSSHSLIQAKQIAAEYGLHYVYIGNREIPAARTTFCPGCGEALVRRAGYEVREWAISREAGRSLCAGCATEVDGVFEEGPESWGNRRQAVDPSQF